MLNYIRGELYKVTHRKYLYVFLGIILALEGILLFSGFRVQARGNTIAFADVLSMLLPLLVVGLYLVCLFVDAVFSDQYKYNTLKNEVSFGLPRSRIYLGKLAVEAIVAAVFCAMILAVYFGVSWLLFSKSAQDGVVITMMGYALATAIPLWLGALGLSHMILFLVKSSTGGSFLFVGIIAASKEVLQLVGGLAPATRNVTEFLYSILLSTPFDLMRGPMDTLPLRGLLTGLGWLVGSTVIGLMVFRKRDVN